MKKIIALLIAAMMLVSLAACAQKDNNSDADENVNGTEDNLENNENQENNDAETPDGNTDDTTGDDADTPDDNTGDSTNPDNNTGSTDNGNSGSGSTGNSGSGNTDSGNSGSTGSALDLATSPLTDIMASILANVADLPMVGEVELTSENFDFYSFTDYVDGYEGLASDAMINAIAHSVVLVRVPDGTDVEAVRADIEANATPAKWVCVTAEKTTVSANGNLILLVMSSAATADAITANFLAL